MDFKQVDVNQTEVDHLEVKQANFKQVDIDQTKVKHLKVKKEANQLAL